MVVQSEQIIDDKYRKQGYKVLNKGHVDRIYFLLDGEGNIIPESIIFCEIKYGPDRLKYEQGVMKKIIQALQLNYKLEYVKTKQFKAKKPITRHIN